MPYELKIVRICTLLHKLPSEIMQEDEEIIDLIFYTQSVDQVASEKKARSERTRQKAINKVKR